MDRIVVRASGPLRGRVVIGGAKNSVLKLMAASLLSPGTYELRNVPAIADVGVMGELLGALGATVVEPERGRLLVDMPDEVAWSAPAEHVGRIRASTALLGPLLARCGRAELCLPGGDDFGSRPIDLHVAGLEALGATVEEDGPRLRAWADRLVGTDIDLPFPSVGATENILMAAVAAEGRTVLDNAAREPEIVDLCDFLTSLGARIEGAGTSTVTVDGVALERHTSPVVHDVVPDRVEAATYLAAAATSGGEVEVCGARPEHMEMFLRKVTDMGVLVSETPGGLHAKAPDRLVAVDVQTLPYPGVATDYKPMVTAMLSVASGTAVVTENLFAGRFRYVEELVRMGADITTASHHAVVRGVPLLHGCTVRAHDIRAGASLLVAALAAEGETVITDAHHLDRGYEQLETKLRGLGADVERASGAD